MRTRRAGLLLAFVACVPLLGPIGCRTAPPPTNWTTAGLQADWMTATLLAENTDQHHVHDYSVLLVFPLTWPFALFILMLWSIVDFFLHGPRPHPPHSFRNCSRCNVAPLPKLRLAPAGPAQYAPPAFLQDQF